MAASSDPSALLERVRTQRPSLWINPDRSDPVAHDAPAEIDPAQAESRMRRAAPLLHRLWPAEVTARGGIASPLLPADRLPHALGVAPGYGRWLIKADHQLPVAGSVKARGGFHEVLAVAERLAIEAGLLAPESDLEALACPAALALFREHSIVVGSTGNLGMAIGLLSAALGFSVTVHMSSDAKAWKMQRLRDAGVTVIEHAGDYLNAVTRGRDTARNDARAHFVDDERSPELFTGYAAAAPELATHVRQLGISVDAEHPLFVYLPCGVGGAPGGITYGLREQFGTDVHCFFAEPVGAACMMSQLASGRAAPFPISELGLSVNTAADGLAVGLASELVAPMMRSRLDGVYTLTDEHLFLLLGTLAEAEGIVVEPSAAAGIAGPLILLRSPSGRAYLAEHGLADKMPGATHVIWTTGGALVPPAERASNLARARVSRADLSFSGV